MWIDIAELFEQLNSVFIAGEHLEVYRYPDVGSMLKYYGMSKAMDGLSCYPKRQVAKTLS